MDKNWLDSGASARGFDWHEGDRRRGGRGSRGTPTGNHGISREVIQSAPDDAPTFQRIWWLESASHAARSVGMIDLPNGSSATGFLIGPSALLTNHHVFSTRDDARDAVLNFNFRDLADGDLAPVDRYDFDPDTLFKTDAALDYSLVGVKPKNGREAGEVWGVSKLLPEHQEPRLGQRVNIIQHPRRRFQEIVFRDNRIKAIDDTKVQYLADTQQGSSGSPVFDDLFRVVALHSQAVPAPGDPGRLRNQGFLIHAILVDAASKPG